ncbi:hypothetical protein [Brachyspira aalborgi]|uniref:hypothetical protein n=1 Tax=Brachyspira aalborgi TaxID=29522 RepID=UPI00266D388A|nr:hypothetical protein [Brachyspira aalborgi]
MFDYFYYYPLPLFLNPIFSLALIICLGIITPYIIILANKDKDYKNKKLFIIYEKAINILSFLHIALTLIFIIISILAYRYGLIFLSLIIVAVGIAIIYGIFYILEKNNIFITKPNINKIFYVIGEILEKIFYIFCVILYAIVPICLIGLCVFIFVNSNYNNNSESNILLIIALILLSIFLLLYFLVIMINSKLNKIIKNNKNNSSNELETTKKDNKDKDYII